MFSSLVNLSLKPIVLSLLVIINCIFGLSRLLIVKKSQSYTYFSDDYPLEAPIDNFERVAMTQFQGTHFQLNASDRVSNIEWGSIYSGPYTMHLGIEERVFLIAMFHETHCLRAMEYTFLHPSSTAYLPAHIQHCINYLRQHFLCAADDQLENGDFLMQNIAFGSVYNQDMVCRDWERIRSVAADNLRHFTKGHKM